MAAPSVAELKAQLPLVADLYKEIYRLCENDGADDIISIQDAIVQAMEGDAAAEITAGVEAIRRAIGGARLIAGPMSGHLRDWGRFLDIPQTGSIGDIIDRMTQYFDDNSETVESRAFTYGAVVAGGSNVGSGTIHRVTTDALGYLIENSTPEVKTFRCVGDANTDTDRNREVFSVRGQTAIDAVELASGGSGIDGALAVTSPADGLVLNPDFNEFGGTAAIPTSLTNWVVATSGTSALAGDGSDVVMKSSIAYLPAPDADTTKYVMTVKITETFSQRLDLGGGTLPIFGPIFAQLAWNRDAGAMTGTIALHVGAVSNSVTMAAQAGWQELNYLATPDGVSSWYLASAEEALDVKIVVTSTGGTSVDLANLTVAAYNLIDGCWYIIVPGETPFRAGAVAQASGDTFTFTDTCVESQIQRIMWELYGRYLPHHTSPTIADP